MYRIRPSYFSWRSFFGQLLVTIVVAGILLSGIYAIHNGMMAHGIGFSFNFLHQQAGFQISEGKTIASRHGHFGLRLFNASDSYGQAFITGLYNTIRVSLFGILFSTIIGVVVGSGRLSSNWLVKQLCFVYVELIRNTPLLVQLFFWYFAVILKLPPLTHAVHLYGSVTASQQGIYFPTLVPTQGWEYGQYLLYGGIVVGCLIWRLYKKRGRFLLFLLPIALAWGLDAVVWGNPLSLGFPHLGKFNATGGLQLSPEFCAILLALVVYTAAFIAEIVRGAIQSIDTGQWEAARSLGLRSRQTMRLIILPQARRVIVPSLGNQYVNLAKNTSLAIAVGFPDLFNVYGTIANQSGRNIEGILIIMLAYLLLNLIISACVNFYNRRVMAGNAG